MTTTTEYGTLKDILGGGSTDTLTAWIDDAIGGDKQSYDVAAIAAELRDEINAVLPAGVTLQGETMIYGPYPRPYWWADGDAAQWLELRAEIEAIDLGTIAAGHER